MLDVNYKFSLLNPDSYSEMEIDCQVTVIWMLLMFPCITAWIIKQPQENVWVTLAKSLQQDSLCLSMGNAHNPLSTYLVGIPLQPQDYPFTGKRPNPVDIWDEWTGILPHATEEPQELDLLGSSTATYCVNFFYRQKKKAWSFVEQQRSLHRKDVSPNNKIYKTKNWCNYTAATPSVSTRHPRVLPRRVFLIYGDRVWVGIPSRLQGGPPTLGKFTILTPNTTLIHDWKTNKKRIGP